MTSILVLGHYRTIKRNSNNNKYWWQLFFPQDCVEKHQTMTNSGRQELKMTMYKSIAVNDKLRLQRIGWQMVSRLWWQIAFHDLKCKRQNQQKRETTHQPKNISSRMKLSKGGIRKRERKIEGLFVAIKWRGWVINVT